MMPGPRTKLKPNPEGQDGKYGDKPPLLPDKNIFLSTSLDSLECRLSQTALNKDSDGDTEEKLLTNLDNCIRDSASAENVSYEIRPQLGQKFKPMVVSDVIHDVLYEELREKVYSREEAREWTLTISDSIRSRLKDQFDRYKIMVQVVIGEHRGAGCVIGCRCCWDSDTDAFATNQFINDTIFCCAMVFGVYHY